MYLDSLILEGFKSYPQRTVVDCFDQKFNAITGLNGSGKSNLLDAICFVLGILNLSVLRSNSLSDLVYKKGQCGIQKCSVTLVFNNQRINQSPPGYKDCPQISITRQVR